MITTPLPPFTAVDNSGRVPRTEQRANVTRQLNALAQQLDRIEAMLSALSEQRHEPATQQDTAGERFLAGTGWTGTRKLSDVQLAALQALEQRDA